MSNKLPIRKDGHPLTIEWIRLHCKITESGCWIWRGSRRGNGYGAIRINNRLKRIHRVAYEVANGSPGKRCVLHKCDVRNCVNPDHLWTGTQIDNISDMDAKKRRVPLPGESNGFHKLTENEVVEILASSETQSRLAKRFGVSVSNISLIQIGKAWKHLKRPEARS